MPVERDRGSLLISADDEPLTGNISLFGVPVPPWPSNPQNDTKTALSLVEGELLPSRKTLNIYSYLTCRLFEWKGLMLPENRTEP